MAGEFSSLSFTATSERNDTFNFSFFQWADAAIALFYQQCFPSLLAAVLSWTIAYQFSGYDRLLLLRDP